MSIESRLRLPLFLLRAGVFIVMIMWTLDKFVNPDHAAAIYERFYLIGGLAPLVMTVIGVVELILIVGFVLGIRKTITYGAVLALHTVSTLSSWQQYLGFDSLLFFAAWHMLAACYALFSLRDFDTMLTVRKQS